MDEIFKHPEAPLLMKHYIREQLNLNDQKVQSSIASMLKQKGITINSSVEDAQKVLGDELTRNLQQYGVEIPREIQESVKTIMEIFEYVYDEKIKPLLSF